MFLAADFDQLPFGDQLLGTWRHFAELADDFQLFGLSRLGKLGFQLGQLGVALATATKFTFAFTGSHENLPVRDSLLDTPCQKTG